jgi:cellobiose phosphorylase
MPSGWSGFEAVRSFRGVRYEISVQREGAGSCVTLEVDGKSIEGTETKTIKVKALVR